MLHGPRYLRQFTSCLQIPPRPQRRSLLTLAIETSCDDTCVAVLCKRSRSTGDHDPNKVFFNEKVTARNTGRGGIHPLEAESSHHESLSKLVARSLEALPPANGGNKEQHKLWLQDGSCRRKPDFISVTRGPGMRSNLHVGLNTAKGLATAWQIPMVGVHHMQAHALTPRLVHAMATNGKAEPISPKPAFPFLTLLVSGGHTMLMYSKDLVNHSIMATTIDTAIGDCLDKCGRLILPEEVRRDTPDTAYGKYLSRYAFAGPEQFPSWPVPQRRVDEIQKPPNKFGWKVNAPFVETRDLVFAYASIASQVQALAQKRPDMSEEERVFLARTAVGTSFEHLGSRTIMVLEKLRDQGVHIPTLVVSGGVAANDFLRDYLRKLLDARSFGQVDLIFPPVELCTDNAAMIGWAGMEMFEAGYRTDLGIEGRRKWSMDPTSEDGGILGVGGWLKNDVQ